MHATPLPAFEYRRMRWKNNLGWTREILRVPDEDDYAWRASIAEIDHDCGFSAFPGCDRVLVLLEGEGMRLSFEGGDTVDLLPPHGRIAFRGEDALHCTLVQGPTRDFNLIWKRDRVHAELLHRPLVGPMVFFPEDDVEWLVHVLAGQARVKDRADLPLLERGDSLRLAPAGDGARVILDGGAELLLARISRPGARVVPP